jgi:SCP-2 sterol transfer family
MPDRTTQFFDALSRRGHEPLLEEVTGTIRFDLEHDHGVDHWFLAISHGDVRVSREDRDADAVIRTTKALFDRLASGEVPIYAAWVRNELRALGDIRLGRLVERIMPGPPGAHHPRTFARERRQQA